jgi:hypothetical protein
MVSQKLKILRGIMVRNGGFSKTSFFVVCNDIWIAIYPPVVVVSTTLFVLPSWFLLMQVQLVMAGDDATLSNPPVTPVQQEELEEAPLDLNVFQRPREEKPPRRVVRTRVDRSV